MTPLPSVQATQTATLMSPWNPSPNSKYTVFSTINICSSVSSDTTYPVHIPSDRRRIDVNLIRLLCFQFFCYTSPLMVKIFRLLAAIVGRSEHSKSLKARSSRGQRYWGRILDSVNSIRSGDAHMRLDLWASLVQVIPPSSVPSHCLNQLEQLERPRSNTQRRPTFIHTLDSFESSTFKYGWRNAKRV